MKKLALPIFTIFLAGLTTLLPSTTSYAQDREPTGLNVGDKAPDFKGVDQTGRTVHLKELLGKGPVVVVFYRGEWCPYCNKHLQQLEDSLQFFRARGVSLIAVTPERPEYISKTIEKTKASFPILHDEKLKIMKDYKVNFRMDSGTLTVYKKYDLDFNVINGLHNGPNLPIPAVYIIKPKGIISYRYFNANYRNRPSVATLLKQL